MPSHVYTGKFKYFAKDGTNVSSEEVLFSLYTTETKSPSVSTKKQPSGWRPMTTWGSSSSSPQGIWVGWTGSGTIKLLPAYGGDGSFYTIENPRYSYLGYPEQLDLPSLTPDSELILSAKSQIKGQKVNLGMVVSGARQTLQTIWKDLSVWKEASKALKRRDSLATFKTLQQYANAKTWRQRSKFLRARRRYERDQKRFKSHYEKTLADFWLALNFCYMQLAQDIDGSVKELNRPAADPFVHGRSGSRAEAKGGWMDGNQLVHPSLGVYGNVEFRYRAKRSAVRYCHLAYMVDNSGLRRLSQVGLTNPLAVAYDIMPWTWVFDWVLPLGKWINNLDATVGLSWVDGCMGEKHSNGFEVTGGKQVANPIAFFFTGFYNPELMADETFRRVRFLDEPNISDMIPEVRSPFKDVLWKIATTAALIGQLKR